MKPIIGVMPLWDDDKNSIWMLPDYMDAIQNTGGLPIILPMTTDDSEIKQVCNLCSGFLFTGGHDVDCKIYGEIPIPNMGLSCQIRDSMETQILEYCIKNDKPLLGICRGIQFINASLGGTLFQDLPTQYNSSIEHHMNAPYDRVVHKVKVYKDSPLYKIISTEELGVNSYHHQAIKDLSNKLIAMAESEDGLIESVYMPNKKYIYAFQWHPEYSFKVEDSSRKIFKSFIDACKI